MSHDGQDWLAQAHWQAAGEYLEREKRELALVKQTHEAACEQQRQVEERARQLLDQSHRQALERYSEQHVLSTEAPSIHYTELQDLPADSPICEEWQTYRRELPRLLKEGLEGRFALVKGTEIVGVFATLDEGIRVGRQKYLLQPFLVQPIREREPLLRLRGSTLPCRNFIIRSPRMR